MISARVKIRSLDEQGQMISSLGEGDQSSNFVSCLRQMTLQVKHSTYDGIGRRKFEGDLLRRDREGTSRSWQS